MLIFHVTLDRIQVLADICFLGQDFNLNLDGADFEPTGERRNNVLLFTDTPEKEVDGFNLSGFGAAVLCLQLEKGLGNSAVYSAWVAAYGAADGCLGA